MNSSKSLKLASKHFYKILLIKPLLTKLNYKKDTEFLILDKSSIKLWGKEILLLEVESKNNKYKDVIIYTDSKDKFNDIVIGKRAIQLSVLGFRDSNAYYVVNCVDRFKSLVMAQKIVNYWFKCLLLNIFAIISVIICIYACVFWLAVFLL